MTAKPKTATVHLTQAAYDIIAAALLHRASTALNLAERNAEEGHDPTTLENHANRCNDIRAMLDEAVVDARMRRY